MVKPRPQICTRTCQAASATKFKPCQTSVSLFSNLSGCLSSYLSIYLARFIKISIRKLLLYLTFRAAAGQVYFEYYYCTYCLRFLSCNWKNIIVPSITTQTCCLPWDKRVSSTSSREVGIRVPDFFLYSILVGEPSQPKKG